MTLTPGVRLGPYEIVAGAGSGGMGEVYKARDTRLERTVAIKVLPALLGDDPELRHRLEREARAISSLDHPHICALYDVGRERPTPATAGGREVDFLVMQYLDGETLAARLERGPLPIDEAVRIGAQLADALAAAHRRGLVHRDLKPGNVMLTKAGARLLDFGLAKEASLGGAPARPAGEVLTVETPLTAERAIVGTLQYMAPEQLEGRDVDARTDIFALGAVLYETVTGQRAFEGDSSAGLIASILRAEPRPIASFVPLAPPALSRTVERCLAKHPDDRWQSAGDLAFELRSIGQSSGVLQAASPERRPRRALPYAVAALAGVASIVAIGYFARSGGASVARDAPELRLSVLPPGDHTFTTDVADYNPEFALSPDGRQLAFTAVNPGGETELWIRPLASLEARLLPGTTGAKAPFWSYDGGQVGYFVPSGLARVPVSGGSPQLVASVRITSGAPQGSWAPDGRLLFERASLSGGGRVRSLYLVESGGSTPIEVPVGARTPTEIARRFPQFLPDGRHFIYLSWSADPAERAIYLGSLDSDTRSFLVKTGFRADYVDPGYLVYVRDRVLVAQKLSLDPPRLVGEPQPVVEGVALEAIPGQSTFAVSRSGTIAYRSRSRELVSDLRWIDRTGRVGDAVAAPASDITVSLSPDGRRVLTTRLLPSTANEERLPSNIWLADLSRRISTRLTVDASGVDENPIWSPDGRTFAFASHRASGLADVRVMGAAESGTGRTIASGVNNFHPIDWSSDGRVILLHAYATGSGSDNLDLWTMPAPPASGEPQPFLEGDGAQAQGQFSPDGRWVAYVSDESGRPEVYVRRFPSGGDRWQISSNGGAQPRWRADGREIFYVSTSGTLMAVPVSADNGELIAGTAVALFTEPSLRINSSVFFYGGAAAYDVDRDGRRFIVNRLTREPTASPIQVVINAIRK